MQEQLKIQSMPLKVYRSDDRIMLAAPLPGLQPEDINVQVQADNHVIIQGKLRGTLKDLKTVLLDEWSIGGYYRDMTLPVPVDAEHANLNYGNGVLVVTLPIANSTTPANLTMQHSGIDRGERTGNSGHMH